MKNNPNCTRWPYPKAILNVTRVTSRLDDLLCMQSSKSKQTITALWAVWPYQGWQIKRSTISAYENEIELIFFFLISFTQKKKGKLFWCICLFSFTAGKEEKKNEKEKESCPDKDSCICCFRPYTTANRQYTWAPQTCFFSWNFPLSLYTWLAPSFLPIFSISRSQLLTTFFLFSSANIFFSFRFCNNS